MAKGKKKTGCIIAIIIAVVLLVGLIILIKMGIGMAQNMMSNTPYGKATVRDLSEYVSISGNVSSSSTTNVTTELMQKVKKLNVKVGDNVKKGDVICELDSSSLQESYDKLNANAEKAQSAEEFQNTIRQRNLADAKSNRTAMLNKAQQAINDAERERDEAYNTYNANVEEINSMIAQIDAADEETAAQMQKRIEMLGAVNEKLYPQLPSYDAAVKAAQEAYNETQRSADQLVQSAQDAIDAEQYTVTNDSTADDLAKLREQIDACTITAPADGVVTRVAVDEGGIPVNGNLMTIENTDSLVIRGKVNEADILRISEKMPCEIKASAAEGDVIQGSVKRIERIISSNEDATSGYTVEISIDDPKSKLLIGMSANAKIILNKVENVLCLPYDSVRGGENEGFFVLVAEPAEAGTVKVVKKTVETGFEGDYYIELKSGDIKEDDIVFTGTYGAEIPEEGSVIPDPTLKSEPTNQPQ